MRWLVKRLANKGLIDFDKAVLTEDEAGRLTADELSEVAHGINAAIKQQQVLQQLSKSLEDGA